jgi:hypothetical protein
MTSNKPSHLTDRILQDHPISSVGSWLRKVGFDSRASNGDAMTPPISHRTGTSGRECTWVIRIEFRAHRDR